MKKVFLFLLPVFLFAEISHDLLFACHQNDFTTCAKVGSIRMDRFDPDYDPSHAVEPLKMSCQYGKNASSCKTLSSYYASINDLDNYISYLKIGCNLHDGTSCYLYHRAGGN